MHEANVNMGVRVYVYSEQYKMKSDELKQTNKHQIWSEVREIAPKEMS